MGISDHRMGIYTILYTANGHINPLGFINLQANMNPQMPRIMIGIMTVGGLLSYPLVISQFAVKNDPCSLLIDRF